MAPIRHGAQQTLRPYALRLGATGHLLRPLHSHKHALIFRRGISMHPTYNIHLRALCLFIVAALLPVLLGGAANNDASAAKQEPQRNRVLITPREGEPYFVIGANYEGPTDRAWAMWEDDKFDIALIEGDFARARSLGINTLRIFVQSALREDIAGGDFTKLDAVTALARKHGLWLILTFTDWAEPDVAKAGVLNARIAAHLTVEPSIFAYDAKNE